LTILLTLMYFIPGIHRRVVSISSAHAKRGERDLKGCAGSLFNRQMGTFFMEKTTDEALRFVGWLQLLPHSSQVLARVQGRCAPWPWTRAALLAVAQADAEASQMRPAKQPGFQATGNGHCQMEPKVIHIWRKPRWVTFRLSNGYFFKCQSLVQTAQVGTFSIVKWVLFRLTKTYGVGRRVLGYR